MYRICPGPYGHMSKKLKKFKFLDIFRSRPYAFLLYCHIEVGVCVMNDGKGVGVGELEVFV